MDDAPLSACESLVEASDSAADAEPLFRLAASETPSLGIYDLSCRLAPKQTFGIRFEQNARKWPLGPVMVRHLVWKSEKTLQAFASALAEYPGAPPVQTIQTELFTLLRKAEPHKFEFPPWLSRVLLPRFVKRLSKGLLQKKNKAPVEGELGVFALEYIMDAKLNELVCVWVGLRPPEGCVRLVAGVLFGLFASGEGAIVLPRSADIEEAADLKQMFAPKACLSAYGQKVLMYFKSPHVLAGVPLEDYSLADGHEPPALLASAISDLR